MCGFVRYGNKITSNYSWIDGELVWHVPFGWNESNTTEKVPEFARFAEDTRQIIVIFSSGLTGLRPPLFDNIDWRP